MARYENIEFIPIYRAEGEAVAKEDLSEAHRGTAGRWWTKDFDTAKRYADVPETDRQLYTLAIPRVFYENLQAGLKETMTLNADEILVPDGLEAFKVEFTGTEEVDKSQYARFMVSKEAAQA